MIHKTDNLEAIVWQLYDAGFRPSIKYGAGKLSWVSLTVNNCTFIVKSQQMIDWAIDGMMEVHDAGVFNRLQDAKTEFHYQLFRSEHRSYYNAQDIEILDECRTAANVGWLHRLVGTCANNKKRPPTIPRSSLAEIDISKAYTGAFIRIKSIPVFNEFDTWQAYKPEEPIKNMSLYIVEASSFDLFFNKRYNLCYGYFLKQLKQRHTIKAVKHPSIIKKVSYKDLVEELWKTPISDDTEEDAVLKKTIANCNYGMLEKQINRTQKSKIFDTYEDAKFFQLKYGGDITFIKQYEERSEWRTESPLDEGVEGAPMIYTNEMVPTGRSLFILNLYAEASLTNGFRYIKELLMQHHNFYLNNSYKLLTDNGIDVYTVKTDAFTIRQSQVDAARELLSWEEGIGSWRLNRTEDIKFPIDETLMALKENRLVQIHEHVARNIELAIEDEYDTDKLCGYIEEHRRMMIRAEYGGCGKSYTCKSMETRGHKVLFVCPTNKLANNYKEHGCTINKFFGVGLTESTRLAKFDDSGYDTIVFDEIFFCSVRNLARIKRYCESNPDKIVVATGDTDQLECIDCITNQNNYDEYYNRCVDMIFPVGMFLKENKRLKSKKDKETLKRFKRDIFDESIPVSQTIGRYFKTVEDINTKYNLAYRNSTCHTVSEEVRSILLKKSQPYEPGETLVCRSWFKVKKQVFNVNYEYEIAAVEGEMITLSNNMSLPVSLIKKNFVHNYCRTCHSFQGSTIDEAITIFDHKFAFVTRKWLYTAVTRATNLKQVYFYDYDESAEKETDMVQYFARKVENYRLQDKKANRSIDDSNFITKEWLMSCVGKSCGSCGDCLTYSRTQGKIDCNLSAQRVCNNEAHHLDNVVPYCVYCNTAMSNR